jgi:hypothetical protein
MCAAFLSSAEADDDALAEALIDATGETVVGVLLEEVAESGPLSVVGSFCFGQAVRAIANGIIGSRKASRRTGEPPERARLYRRKAALEQFFTSVLQGTSNIAA